MKNQVCKWWGHDMCEEALHYYAVFECRRCGKVYESDTGIREWLRVRLWLAQQWLEREWASWKYWYRCSDCGRRFGKHDDSQDHLPF